MTDATTIAGFLLVVGPVAGAVPIAHPQLMRVWSAPREQYLATIGAHRRAWYALNAGFAVATLATAAGLAVLAVVAGLDDAPGQLLLAITVAYALGGSPWLAMLAIRAARDPLLADMLADGRTTEPAEALLGAATGGLFASFVLITGTTLVALSAVLWSGGIVAPPVAAIAGLIAVVVLAIQLRSGDCIPAILYVPTVLVGIALLAGWT